MKSVAYPAASGQPSNVWQAYQTIPAGSMRVPQPASPKTVSLVTVTGTASASGNSRPSCAGSLQAGQHLSPRHASARVPVTVASNTRTSSVPPRQVLGPDASSFLAGSMRSPSSSRACSPLGQRSPSVPPAGSQIACLSGSALVPVGSASALAQHLLSPRFGSPGPEPEASGGSLRMQLSSKRREGSPPPEITNDNSATAPVAQRVLACDGAPPPRVSARLLGPGQGSRYSMPASMAASMRVTQPSTRRSLEPTRSSSVRLPQPSHVQQGRSASVRLSQRVAQPARSASPQMPVQRLAVSQRPSSNPPSKQRAVQLRQRTDAAMNSDEMEARSSRRNPSVALAALGRPEGEARDLVQVVSLGNSCATKLSIRRLGLDEATLPCDWIRSSMEGLLHWLRHDFNGFLCAEGRYDLTMQDCAMTVFRSRTHSFFHDDLDDAGTKEKLQRRVDRFLGLGAESMARDAPRALLFVRSVASSSELQHVETLFDLLKERFECNGRKVYLHVIIDSQPFAGPVLHARHEDRLTFWLQPLHTGKLALDGSAPAPYDDAIGFAVRRLLDGPSQEEEREWPRVQRASEIMLENGFFWKLGVRETDSGLWVGKVRLEGSAEDVLFAAFEGGDTCSSSKLRTAVRPNPAWLGA